MNKPVKYPLARLLKEKGFDTATSTYYYNKGKNFFDSKKGKYNHNSGLYISAPTISDVVMWLLEKHGIWIEVSIPFFSTEGYRFGFIINKEWESFRFPISVFDRFDSLENKLKEGFISPTEAYEAAIEYCLNELI